MAETAVQTVGHIVSPLPVRQRVLSVQKHLRRYLEREPQAAGAGSRILLASSRRNCASAGTALPSSCLDPHGWKSSQLRCGTIASGSTLAHLKQHGRMQEVSRAVLAEIRAIDTPDGLGVKRVPVCNRDARMSASRNSPQFTAVLGSDGFAT